MEARREVLQDGAGVAAEPVLQRPRRGRVLGGPGGLRGPANNDETHLPDGTDCAEGWRDACGLGRQQRHDHDNTEVHHGHVPTIFFMPLPSLAHTQSTSWVSEI